MDLNLRDLWAIILFELAGAAASRHREGRDHQKKNPEKGHVMPLPRSACVFSRNSGFPPVWPAGFGGSQDVYHSTLRQALNG
ncbi:MAG: hypothetical protein ACKO56_10885 [Paracoccaceae bacterium]